MLLNWMPRREIGKRESKKRDREKGESGKYESGSGKQRGGSGKRKAGQLGCLAASRYIVSCLALFLEFMNNVTLLQNPVLYHFEKYFASFVALMFVFAIKICKQL